MNYGKTLHASRHAVSWLIHIEMPTLQMPGGWMKQFPTGSIVRCLLFPCGEIAMLSSFLAND
jgi:hypothetical protein